MKRFGCLLDYIPSPGSRLSGLCVWTHCILSHLWVIISWYLHRAGQKSQPILGPNHCPPPEPSEPPKVMTVVYPGLARAYLVTDSCQGPALGKTNTKHKVTFNLSFNRSFTQRAPSSIPRVNPLEFKALVLNLFNILRDEVQRRDHLTSTLQCIHLKHSISLAFIDVLYHQAANLGLLLFSWRQQTAGVHMANTTHCKRKVVNIRRCIRHYHQGM